jgi:hypothetical protein
LSVVVRFNQFACRDPLKRYPTVVSNLAQRFRRCLSKPVRGCGLSAMMRFHIVNPCYRFVFRYRSKQFQINVFTVSIRICVFCDANRAEVSRKDLKRPYNLTALFVKVGCSLSAECVSRISADRQAFFCVR